MPIHTIESMRNLLNRNPRNAAGRSAVELGIVALWRSNSGLDDSAKIMASVVLSGQSLTGRFSVKAHTMCHRHVRVLADIVNGTAKGNINNGIQENTNSNV